ncbi:MAG TPA: membrane-bound PQQ-dependent dehydrogenase, glucose/quinate/shikimate family [Sphingomonas sp.]|uniref:membrane-bound PQQ-dependent dehydrogenase, glucose/quinate/shikimate family n=1 Tax=Sphingomonas sp. TaxID=28214 RepID=UPI002C9D6262|nr:membrane-bound PQQ-dependent dehydrogenase, glucose/quinate/shikimate family [Sphingomonas sp.]HMI21130.1 membrane-bound PQQ-dependent dehydrogenase, glucose/quinate/shikimate family [Sphingomonas sp.]
MNRRIAAILWRLPLVAVGLLLILIGLPMAIMGYRLATLGGSLYYLPTGIALIATGLLLGLKRTEAVTVFAATFLATIIWALWEAGLDFWPQVPRILSPTVIAIFIAAVSPLLPWKAERRFISRASFGAIAALSCLVAAFVIEMFLPHGIVRGEAKDWPRSEASAQATRWDHFGNSGGGTRYVDATQLTPENVAQLRPAWIYHSGHIPTEDQAEEATPLQIGGTLYLCTAANVMIALDAETGRELWKFDPNTRRETFGRCRGLAYFEMPAPAHPQKGSSGSGREACVRRVVGATVDARLVEVDADTGRPCLDFGDHGNVNLSQGMGEIPAGYWYQTSAPTVARGLIIIGGYHLDNRSTREPSGVVRAFDAMTGALIWAWDLGNPAISKMPPPGGTYTPGTPNVWAPPSVDESLGLVYLPTGNATPDFWGGNRSAEKDKYSSSVVAVDIGTGKVRWAFQTVHHDIWDYDVASQPILYDLAIDAKHRLPALIQLTKRGQIFLLDRRDGRPIAPVEEKRVAIDPAPGDRNAPTQPYSTGMPAIGAQRFTESQMWGATPIDQLWCRLTFKRARYDGEFTPPNVSEALQYPGQTGGMNWGSASIDERHGYMFVNDIRLFYRLQLIPRRIADRMAGFAKTSDDPHSPYAPQKGTPFAAFRTMFASPLGFPCQNPPYGTMTAIDLKTRRISWQRPMGTLRDTGPLGITGLDFPIGMPTLGGSTATAGGLVFFAGTRDASLRALDARNGREVWRQRLPLISTATPISYISPRSGRQFVAVVAGGAIGKTRGDYVIGYTVPRKHNQ